MEGGYRFGVVDFGWGNSIQSFLDDRIGNESISSGSIGAGRYGRQYTRSDG